MSVYLPSAARVVSQIGVESTPGTAVPANRRPRAVVFRLKPNYEGRERNTQAGSLVPGSVNPGYVWQAGEFEGVVNFPDLAYVLSASFGDVSATQVMDGTTGTGAYRRQWSLSGFSFTAPKSLTVERGIPGGQAMRSAGVVVSQLEFSFERTRVGVSGSIVGQPIETGVSLTASPTDLARAVADPRVSKVYLASSPSGLDSATPLARAFEASVNFGERIGIVPLLGGQPSQVAQPAEPEFELQLATDAEGVARIDELNQNQRVFARLYARGPIIYDGATFDVYHDLTIDLALEWMEYETDETDGVWTVRMTGAIVEEPGFGYAKVTLVSTVNAL
jgi:hypothetical protein